MSKEIWLYALKTAGGSSAFLPVELDGDNKLKVNDTEVNFTVSDPIPVYQVSGYVDSVYITGAGGTLSANVVDSTGVIYNGANPFPITGTVVVSSITASVAAVLVDPTGVSYSGANPVPMTGTVVVSSVTASVAAVIVDPTGASYNGDNPLSTKIVSGIITSSVVTGPVVKDAADDGSAPVQIGGLSRSAVQQKVADNDVNKLALDLAGRAITRPVQCRELIATAYATLTNGTEASLLAGVSGVYQDLIYIMGANNSDVAATVDVRSNTLASVVLTLRIPANGTAGVALPVPIPQAQPQDTWTVDMEDITGTTVYISALFAKEA